MARGTSAQRSPSVEANASTSILGRGARVRGRVSGEGGLRVEGRIEGDVTLTGDLTIDDEGAVEGAIEAASVTIAGTLKGDVAASGAIAIRSTATVEGTMGGTEVSLEEGASFSGRIEAEFDLPVELTTRQGR